jgi:hypothetical protein
MKSSVMLTTASLLSILFTTLHIADDIVRGMEPGKIWDLVVVPILVIWLCGALLLADRRSGYVITLLGGILGALVPVVHFKGAGGVAGGEVANSSGAFFFVWTLVALGVTAVFSIVLSIRGLWSLSRERSGKARAAA